MDNSMEKVRKEEKKREQEKRIFKSLLYLDRQAFLHV